MGHPIQPRLSEDLREERYREREGLLTGERVVIDNIMSVITGIAVVALALALL